MKRAAAATAPVTRGEKGDAVAPASPSQQQAAVFTVITSTASADDCGARPDAITSNYDLVGVFTNKLSAYKAGILSIEQRCRGGFDTDCIDTKALLASLPNQTSNKNKSQKVEANAKKDDDDDDDDDGEPTFLLPDSQDLDNVEIHSWEDCPDNGNIVLLERNDPYEGEFFQVSITKTIPQG